jgi:Tol biopolymer transport system component
MNRISLILLPIIFLGNFSCKPVDPYSLWQEQPNDVIVFMSRADSPEGELYLLDKDNNITRLTTNSRHENNPALSPDGRKVAFNAGDQDDMLTWEIYVLDLETHAETRLTDNSVIDAHPDWSPLGEKLVFGSFRDVGGNPAGAADIYVMNADGSNQVALSPTPWEDNDPEWSPDGSMIAFKSTRNSLLDAREEIFIMNSDGSFVRQLTTTSGWQSDHDPSWSPDNKTVVFNRYEGSRPWTDMTNLDTFRFRWQELSPWNTHATDLTCLTTRLTETEDGGGLPTYNADGSKVLFLYLDYIISGDELVGAYHRLILMDPDGSEQEQMIPDDRHTPTLEYYDW